MKTETPQTENGPSVVQPLLVRLLRDHKRGCCALKAVVEGRWNTPWCGIPETTMWLSKAGDNRGSHTPWLKIRCNNRDCPASKIVLTDVLSFCEPNAES